MNRSFNLENALKDWRAGLRKQQGIEPGYIAELESNLLDRIDDYISQGLNEREAFEKATGKLFETAEEVADEFFKSRTPITHQTPPWKKSAGIINLLPSYLKIAIRSLNRSKGYAAINYIGLMVGLLTVCFVGLYLNYELNWDAFHSKADRIYRVGQLYRAQSYSLVSFENYYSTEREVQLDHIKGFKEVPGVEDVAEFWIFGGSNYLTYNGDRFVEENIISTTTGAGFFNVFDWDWLYGSPDDFSANLNKVVLTESVAIKLKKGDTRIIGSLIGEVIAIDSVGYEISGIIADVPSNSHFDFNIVLHSPRIDYWGARTYALLEPDAKVDDVRVSWENNMEKINARLARNDQGLFKGFEVINLKDMHLKANALYEVKPPGNVRYLYIFGIIGVIVLMITLSNYTNLSVAMYSGRNREIGMRKVMGAGRFQLAGQFLIESMVIALSTIPIVVVLYHLMLPYFNDFMGVQLPQLFELSVSMYVLLVFISLITGLAAGLYPAYTLSGKSINGLFDKQLIAPILRGFNLRKSLITFQFILLIGLGSATWFINSQLHYINQKDIGYAKEGVLYIFMEDSAAYADFKNTASSIVGINNIGNGMALARETYNQTTYSLDGYNEIFDDGYYLYMRPSGLISYEIETTVDELIRDENASFGELMLINKSAADRFATTLGIEKEDLIGATFRTEPSYTQEDGTIGFPYQIAGFFEDINMFSLREEIDPYFMIVDQHAFSNWAIINFNVSNVSSVVEQIEAAYNSLNLETPIFRQFQEDRLETLYEQEQRIAILTVYLSFLAFTLALLGLIGLSAFLTAMRKKEIGVRKILGASNSQLVVQLNKEYIYLILIALIIAAPIAFLAMQNWLSSFAYRIEMNPIIFVFTAIITLGIAAIAVTSQTLRAATSNPVNSLRNDQ